MKYFSLHVNYWDFMNYLIATLKCFTILKPNYVDWIAYYYGLYYAFQMEII